MRKLLPLLFLLTSCSEVLLLSVEQMVPPETIPQYEIGRVGVINNFSQNNVLVSNEDALVYPCNADSVKEHIALAFANVGAVNRVVVLDSLFYHPDSVAPHILSQAEVNTLCARLEVDMLYAVDYACVAVSREVQTVGYPIQAHLCSRIYTPDSDTVAGSSTLDQKTVESWAYDATQVAAVMRDTPYLLAATAVGAYSPQWKGRERVFYSDAFCYELREAKVYVYEGNWEAAAEQWRTLATSKFRAYRFMAAYNMALYYEMTDSIDQAIAQLDCAIELTVKTNKNGDSVQLVDITLANEYRDVLVNRKKEIARIREYDMRLLENGE